MTTPDGQISDEYRERMNMIARGLDQIFNGDAKGEQRKTCFVLLLTEFGNMAGRVNYISNGDRADIVTMLKEVTARFEGQPKMEGKA